MPTISRRRPTSIARPPSASRFFTIDPSDAVDAKADNYPADVLKGRFAEVRDEIDWFDKYRGKQVQARDRHHRRCSTKRP